MFGAFCSVNGGHVSGGTTSGGKGCAGETPMEEEDDESWPKVKAFPSYLCEKCEAFGI